MDKSAFLLEIYEPGSDNTVAGCWPSDLPVSISVGDLIHMSVLQPDMPPRRLTAQRLEHALWMRGERLVHKLMVFTEEAP